MADVHDIAKVVCWSARHPMQHGADATPADAEEAARQCGIPIGPALREAIAVHMATWKSSDKR